MTNDGKMSTDDVYLAKMRSEMDRFDWLREFVTVKTGDHIGRYEGKLSLAEQVKIFKGYVGDYVFVIDNDDETVRYLGFEFSFKEFED